MSRNAAARVQQAPQDVLPGIVERVTFHNAENGICVLRSRACRHRNFMTVVSDAAVISAGGQIISKGDLFNNTTH